MEVSNFRGLEIFFVFFYVITNNYVYLSTLVYISCGEKDHNQFPRKITATSKQGC